MTNPTPLTLDDGPIPFRRWLASLPQHHGFRMRRDEEPCITWLRRVSDPECRFVKGPDGWQEYRIHSRTEEVPGWAFYAYGRVPSGWSVAGVAADFDLYIAERDLDYDGDYVEGYWAEFGPRPEVTEWP